MAEVGAGDVLIDLGSGDGRIVIAAAQARRARPRRGHRPEPGRAGDARTRARPASPTARASRRATSSTPTSRDASVVTFYLLPEFNAKLLPRLLALKPGTRIVSHDGGIGDWPPDETAGDARARRRRSASAACRAWSCGSCRRTPRRWLSEVPQHGGRWRFEIAQQFQELDMTAPRRRARPAGARKPPARQRNQDGGHRHRRQPRLESPVRRPHRRRPHRRPAQHSDGNSEGPILEGRRTRQ